MSETALLPPPTASRSKMGRIGSGDFSVSRNRGGGKHVMWYASNASARVVLGNASLQIVPITGASTPPKSDRYSRGVYARFIAFSAFLTVALLLGALSLVPGLRDLALGTLIAGLLAAFAGLSGAERAGFERRRRYP